jgi:hypothetical protein
MFEQPLVLPSIAGAKRLARSSVWTILAKAATSAAVLLGAMQPVYALPMQKVMAIPAFARKYGLPCSACHTAWPELNNFGQVFRDNGYQLMNDRDSPIYQNPTYFPITFRITPNWHYEGTTHQPVDSIPGGGTGSTLQDKTVTANGFDLSGMDIWTAGTLFKNISFSLLPSSNSAGAFHFENAFIRFDNLLGSAWLNLKIGKFELDNLISEKRFLFLSANGGLYQTYHFEPPGDSTGFGIGDNQIGMEVMGHSAKSYTRYSVALLSSNEGQVGLPTNRTYDTYLNFSQAFQVNGLGLQRLGAFAYIGERPTILQTSSASGTPVPIPGAEIGNKPFYRAGFAGDLYALRGKWEFLPYFVHGYDNAFLGTTTPADMSLPPGAHAPIWNGGFLESHYYVSPQLVLTGRFEIIRMSQQALDSNPSDLGDMDAYSFGYRWYPFMYSRAGLAFHNEYSMAKGRGIVPLSGDGVGAPFSLTSGVWSRSLLIGLDFDF